MQSLLLFNYSPGNNIVIPVWIFRTANSGHVYLLPAAEETIFQVVTVVHPNVAYIERLLTEVKCPINWANCLVKFKSSGYAGEQLETSGCVQAQLELPQACQPWPFKNFTSCFAKAFEMYFVSIARDYKQWKFFSNENAITRIVDPYFGNLVINSECKEFCI